MLFYRKTTQQTFMDVTTSWATRTMKSQVFCVRSLQVTIQAHESFSGNFMVVCLIVVSVTHSCSFAYNNEFMGMDN